MKNFKRVYVDNLSYEEVMIMYIDAHDKDRFKPSFAMALRFLLARL